MDQTELHNKIDQLSEAEAERCLQVLVKGFAVRNDYEELVLSQDQLQEVIREYLILAHKQKEVPKGTKDKEKKGAKGPEAPATEPVPTPTTIKPAQLKEPKKRVAAVRVILHAIADDEELRPALESWFTQGRPTLVDPIVGALVLAGIVFVLSTEGEFEAKKGKKGKVEWKLNLKKKPTKESLIGKFFGIFK